MNIFQIAGHLGRDPETRFTPSGLKVTNFSVAVNQRRGGKEDVTMWVKVTVWGDRFDKLIAYLKKGSAVIAVGELQAPTIYTDKEGRPQVDMNLTADIIKFSPFGKPDRGGEESAAGYATTNQAQAAYQEGGAHAQPAPAYGRAAPSAYQQHGSNAAPNEESLPF